MNRLISSLVACAGSAIIAANLSHPDGTTPAAWAGGVWLLIGLSGVVLGKSHR